MDTKEFMDINGEEIFDTGEPYTFLGVGFNECFGMSYDEYYYEDKPEEEEKDIEKPEKEKIPIETKFMYAELNRANLGCATIGCGGSVINRGEKCYYCKKKERGLI